MIECEEATGSEQTGYFGHGLIGIREGHRTMITKDHIEADVWKWHLFGTGMDQTEVHPSFGHQPAGMLQLTSG